MSEADGRRSASYDLLVVVRLPNKHILSLLLGDSAYRLLEKSLLSPLGGGNTTYRSSKSGRHFYFLQLREKLREKLEQNKTEQRAKSKSTVQEDRRRTAFMSGWMRAAASKRRSSIGCNNITNIKRCLKHR